jgi:hypothetical protein
MVGRIHLAGTLALCVGLSQTVNERPTLEFDVASIKLLRLAATAVEADALRRRLES